MKPLHWIGSSKKDLLGFPDEVRQEAGYCIHLAQCGDKACNAVPMVGFGGAKVLEVVIDNDGNTFRAVYTVKFAKAVYVLHAFQKKSRKGTSTPKPEMAAIRTRLKAAEDTIETRMRSSSKPGGNMNKDDVLEDIQVLDSTGNVFADLDLPSSEEDMLKVAIARAINATINKRGLTQSAAGEIIGVDQAKVSALLRGRLKGFSVERLVMFLVKLGRDVQITISREHSDRQGRVRVKAAAA